MDRLTDDERDTVERALPFLERSMGFVWKAYIGHDLDDLRQIGFTGLVRAVRGFDPSRGDFESRAFCFISEAVRDALVVNRRGNQKRYKERPKFVPLFVAKHALATSPTPMIDVLDELDNAFACLPEKDRKVMEMRSRGFVYREIAEHLGMTMNQVQWSDQYSIARMRRKVA